MAGSGLQAKESHKDVGIILTPAFPYIFIELVLAPALQDFVESGLRGGHPPLSNLNHLGRQDDDGLAVHLLVLGAPQCDSLQNSFFYWLQPSFGV